MACQIDSKAWVKKFDSLLFELINNGKSKAASSTESKTEFKKSKSEIDDNQKTTDLKKVKGIGKTAEKKLKQVGIHSIEQLANFKPNSLSKIKGFGGNSAQKLIYEAKEYLKQTNLEMFNIPIEYDKKNMKGSGSEKASINNEKIKESMISESDVNIIEPNLESSEKDDFALNIDINSNDFLSGENNMNKKIDFMSEVEFGNEEIDYQIDNLIKDNDEKRENNDKTIFSELDISAQENNIDIDLINEVEQEELIEEEDNPDFYNDQFINEIFPDEPKIADPVVESQGRVKNQYTDENRFQKEVFFNNILNDEYEIEYLEKNELKNTFRLIEDTLKSLKYYVIPRFSSVMGKFSEYIDLLGIKILGINENSSLIILIPIKLCKLKGRLLISKKNIEYSPLNNKALNKRERELLLGPVHNELINIQKNIHKNFITEGNLFRFFKKISNKPVITEKTSKKERIFIRSGAMEYKLVVDPVYISNSEPAFLEKSIAFPYQKNSNLHAVDFLNFRDLIEYLEKKYLMLETCDVQKNSIELYYNSCNKMRVNVRNYSIPFVIFGVLFLILIIFRIDFLLSLFVSLGIASIIMYGAIISLFYVNFLKTEKKLVELYNTPYYKRKKQITETDLILINDEFSSKLMDQFIYECLGKNQDFSVVAELEEKKAESQIMGIEDEEDVTISKKNMSFEPDNYEDDDGGNGDIRKKFISKYGSFLED
jgi:hypothetical protein